MALPSAETFVGITVLLCFWIAPRIQQDIVSEKAREIVKLIRDSKIKAQIQTDQVRVTGKVRADLQRVIQLLKQKDLTEMAHHEEHEGHEGQRPEHFVPLSLFVTFVFFAMKVSSDEG